MNPARSRVRLLAAALLGAPALIAAGCAGSAGTAGISDYAYGAGDLTAQVSDTLDRTYAAAISAAEETGVMVRERDRREGRATVKGVMGDGRNVKVSLRSLTPTQTEVKIHVGLLGNEGQSRLIMDRLRYGLAVAP
jgi:hypothetical protein